MSQSALCIRMRGKRLHPLLFYPEMSAGAEQFLYAAFFSLFVSVS